MKKIAIPITIDNLIDDHFGHCDYYGIYTLSDKNEIIDFESLKSENGCGCKSNIASTLANKGVTLMLAGGIGNGAINVLNNSGIQVIRGCAGSAENAVKQFVKGAIKDSGESCVQHDQHHNHGNGHVCNH